MAEMKIDLMSIWTKDKDTLQKEELQLSLEELSGGLTTLRSQKKRAVTGAKRTFDKVVMESSKVPNAKALDDAYLDLKAAQASLKATEELMEMIEGLE